MSDVVHHLKIVPDVPKDASGTAEREDKETDVPVDAAAEVEAPVPAPVPEVEEADAVEERNWAKADWEDIVPRLLLLAMSRLSRMTWRGRRDAVPPGAAEAQDFVNDAIAKTLAGVRVWQEEKCSLFQHLAGVVVSDISHAAEGAENKLTLASDGQAERGEGWPPDVVDDRPDQEERTLWRSEQRRLLGHLDEVDPKLARMAELILIEDIDSSVELARRFDCSTKEIANLRKRLKRALHIFLLAGEETEV